MNKDAKSKFDKTIKRCNRLLLMYLDQKNVQGNANNDLVRAAIVLTVAALDAYVTDVFSEFFITYIKNHKIHTNLEEQLIKYGVSVGFAIGLLKEENPYNKIRNLMLVYYERYTTQRIEVIDKMFELYDIKNISYNAEKKSGIDGLLKTVKLVVERRHLIVHNGDYNNGKIKGINNQDIENINAINIYVNALDEIIKNRFKTESIQ